MILFTLVSIIMVYHNQRYIYQQRAYTSAVVSQLIDDLNIEEEPPLKNTSMIGNLKDIDNLDIPLVHIAYVACGDEGRAYQVINSIRSALYFSNDVAIKFHIFTQSKFENKFHVRFREWHIVFDTQFSYQLYSTKYPDDKKDWVNIFRKCATMKLLLPSILTDVDKVLYMDSDTLFLESASHLWRVLDDFNPNNLMAFSHGNCYNYNPETPYPFYGKLGLNSGVLLMHLDRIRTAKFWVKAPSDKLLKSLEWEEALHFIKKEYTLLHGDQSMLNILFSFNPSKGLEFPCNMNYQLLFCKFTDCPHECCKPKPDGVECPEVEEQGIKVLHGASGVFEHENLVPVGYAIYYEFFDFDLYQDFSIFKRRLAKRINKLETTPDSECIRTYNKHMRTIVPSNSSDNYPPEIRQSDSLLYYIRRWM